MNRSTAKKFLPAGLVESVLARRIRRSWMTRTSTPLDDHLALYWQSESTAARRLLVDLVMEEAESQSDLAFLEYGSHVGVNLNLILQRLAGRTAELYAVEPNREAYDFMLERLPSVVGLHGEDKAFLAARGFPSRPVTVSIVNSVFYCMTPSRAHAVLEKLTQTSQSLVIGDSLEAVSQSKSLFHSDPIYFSHPYGAWLRSAGFDITKVVPSPEPQPQLSGFIVARWQGQ